MDNIKKAYKAKAAMSLRMADGGVVPPTQPLPLSMAARALSTMLPNTVKTLNERPQAVEKAMTAQPDKTPQVYKSKMEMPGGLRFADGGMVQPLPIKPPASSPMPGAGGMRPASMPVAQPMGVPGAAPGAQIDYRTGLPRQPAPQIARVGNAFSDNKPLPFSLGQAQQTDENANAASDLFARTRSFRSGGEVSGPGTGTSDSIDAKLSDGEYVLPADTVEAIGVEQLDALKDATHTPVRRSLRDNEFADGGLFSRAVDAVKKRLPGGMRAPTPTAPATPFPQITGPAAPALSAPSAPIGTALANPNVPAAGSAEANAYRSARAALPVTQPAAPASTGATQSMRALGAGGVPAAVLAGGAAATTLAAGGVAANPEYFQTSIGDDGFAANIMMESNKTPQPEAPVTAAAPPVSAPAMDETPAEENRLANTNVSFRQSLRDPRNVNPLQGEPIMRTGDLIDRSTFTGIGTTPDDNGAKQRELTAQKIADMEKTAGIQREINGLRVEEQDSKAMRFGGGRRLVSAATLRAQEAREQNETAERNNMRTTGVAEQNSIRDAETATMNNQRIVNQSMRQMNFDRTKYTAERDDKKLEQQRNAANDAFAQGNTANDQFAKELDNEFTTGVDANGKPMLDVKGKTIALEGVTKSMAALGATSMKDLQPQAKEQLKAGAALLSRVNADATNWPIWWKPDFVSTILPHELVGMVKDGSDYVIQRGVAKGERIPARYLDKEGADRVYGQPTNRYDSLKAK